MVTGKGREGVNAGREEDEEVLAAARETQSNTRLGIGEINSWGGVWCELARQASRRQARSASHSSVPQPSFPAATAMSLFFPQPGERGGASILPVLVAKWGRVCCCGVPAWFSGWIECPVPSFSLIG